jgi:2-(1,2-epoxy-1,2-dihydrophenyl)acetyl-CoA isomerase
MYKTILYALQEHVATITLNRPEVYNAFNNDMSFELQEALRKAARDETVRVVVLTGAGEKAFCSGQDLKEDRDESADRFSVSLQKRYNPVIRWIVNMPKPVICRLNGVAAGAGCSIALACDVIIAAGTAALLEAFIHIGLVPDSGATYFLPRMLGYRKAFELAAKGNKVSAREAFDLGLVNRVVDATLLDAAVDAEAACYANAPAKAIALIKKMLQRGLVSDLESTLEYEAYCQQIAGETKDHYEGVTAFREKRAPRFNGS